MDIYYSCIVLGVLQLYFAEGQRLVSLNKTITSSSTHKTWGPEYAVDGNLRRDLSNCECCAATNPDDLPWIKLDLGEIFPIERIELLGRNDYGHTFDQMSIKLGTTVSNEATIVTEDSTVREFNHTLEKPQLGRYVTLELGRKDYFVVCELSVYAACSNGTFGTGCSETCGNCDNNATCSPTNGMCNACETGYELPLCKVCADGWYGQNCDTQCGRCYMNATCNKTDGNCPGNQCADGYQESKCDQACSPGTFGPGCSEICGNCDNNGTCNHIYGRCDSCESGYELPLCTDCDDGWYGNKTCDSPCGQCLGDAICDKTTGNCPGGNCTAGYQGQKCDEACENGAYGQNCNKTCGHCLGEEPCDKTNGDCPNSCEAGYDGKRCDSPCSERKYGENCKYDCGNCHNGTNCKPDSGDCENGCTEGYSPPKCAEALSSDPPSNGLVGPIAGGASAVAAIAIITIVVLVILKRRRKENGFSSSRPTFADIPKSEHPDKRIAIKTEPSVEVNKEKTARKKNQDDIKGKESSQQNDQETDDLYYAFISRKSDLKICQLWDYITFKKKEDCLMFYQEYSHLPDGMQHAYDVAMKPKNRGKNRYRGLYAYDHSRVTLEVEDDDEVEYINASFINGYDKPCKFIASQGPTESMRDDFWRMIWQHKAKTIVMLTNLVEKGNDKCILYWPEAEVKTVTYGKITITLLSQKSTLDYVIRYMEICKAGDDRKLPVTQYHYKAWPDKSYPDSTWSLVNFWLKVEDETSKVTDCGPIVVHCSAGIGRTGTFIALDNTYYKTKREGTVKILEVVKLLREQRVSMVQTKDQYVYLHEVVADALLFGTHFIWSSQFEAVYEYLSKKEKGSSMIRLQTQYNIILESIADKKSVQRPKIDESDNEYSNIFIDKKTTQISIDDYRPISKRQVYVQEVGALILQNHEAKDAFIICKSPSESRMMDFWSLIKEQNVKTIVSLDDFPMSSSKRGTRLGVENKNIQDMINLSIAEERKTQIFTERTLTFKDSLDDITVSHLEYNDWASGSNVPKDASSMVQFVEVVLDRQRRLDGTEPVLIYCNNGILRSGLMCVLLTEFYRIMRDGGHINILETVKLMKERKEEIIGNFDQYQFAHDVIRCRVNDKTYQNQ